MECLLKAFPCHLFALYARTCMKWLGSEENIRIQLSLEVFIGHVLSMHIIRDRNWLGSDENI